MFVGVWARFTGQTGDGAAVTVTGGVVAGPDVVDTDLPAGRVWQGDARRLDTVLPTRLRGQIALVVTSPPYGPSTHGHVTTDHTGVHKRNHLYGDLLDRGNLANIGHHRLLAGFTCQTAIRD